MLDHLTDEQLASMEGSSRDAVIARIKAINSVQDQLSGIVVQLTQVLDMMPSEGSTKRRDVNDETAASSSSS